MNYAYIVECNDKTLYTGWTIDVYKRVDNHNNGKGAKYTRGRTPVSLKYFESFETKSEAMKRECEIKRLTRKDKLKLIAEGSGINV